MWKLRISINGQPAFWCDTNQVEYRDAESFCKRLYGDDIVFVGQEFK